MASCLLTSSNSNQPATSTGSRVLHNVGLNVFTEESFKFYLIDNTAHLVGVKVLLIPHYSFVFLVQFILKRSIFNDKKSLHLIKWIEHSHIDASGALIKLSGYFSVDTLIHRYNTKCYLFHHPLVCLKNKSRKNNFLNWPTRHACAMIPQY